MFEKGAGSEGMHPENTLVGVGVLVAAEYLAGEVAAELVQVVAAGVAGTEVFGLDACGADRGVGVGDELGLEDNLGLVEGLLGLLGLQPLGCGFEGFLVVVQGVAAPRTMGRSSSRRRSDQHIFLKGQ